MSRLLLYALCGIALMVFVLEVIALIQGINGARLGAALAILGAIVGFIIRSLIKTKI